jgi:hypothetical protein
MSDDLSHDTHLRAALRHAPDHALAPPAGVSQTILNAARQVHRPPRVAVTAAPVVRVTVARPRALAWLRQWFSSPRLAGGLATGLVAALGLGLWLDLGDQPVIHRPAVDTTAPMRSAQAPAAPAPATETAPPPTEAAPGAAATAGPERPVERATRPAPSPATPAPARRELQAAQEAEASAKATSPVREAAPMADAAPAPATPAERARLAQRSDAPSRSEQRMLSAAGRAAAAAAPEGARATAAEPSAAADAASAGSPALALLRRARSESTGAARWAWTPPGSPLMAPFDERGQAWLGRVVQATRGRWTDVAERSGSADATEVRWWRDEWPQATLRLEADGVRWIEQGGRIRFAPLEAATLARLRSL